MSFFTTSTGDNLAQNNTGSFSMGGDDFAPIPKDTRVLAVCEEAKISEYQGDRYINLKWGIAQPKEYANRKIFQKVQVFATGATKRDKALRMLAAIDANAGGKLAKENKEPTDQSLSAALTNRPMVLKLGVWEIKKDRDGSELPESEWKSGNWVQEVSAKQGNAQAPAPKAAPAPAPRATGGFDDMDDDIPFSDPLKTRGVHAVM